MVEPADPAVDPAHEEIDRAVLRVRSGDHDAFQGIIALCERPLRVVVAAIVPRVEIVDDVVQKSLVIAFFRLDQYEIGTSFLAWIAVIARYQALNERRRWLNERSLKQRLRTEHRLDQALYQGDESAAFGHHALLPHLEDCLTRLRDQAADVVRAHYLAQEPVGDIADRYGRSVDWVHVVLHRARRTLRACLLAKHGAQDHGS
jgi:RNA polymerase sigma factor (sigma-70 family)